MCHLKVTRWDATSEGVTAYPSAASEVITVVYIDLCVVFCRLLFGFFAIFLVAIMLSVSRFTASD